MVAAVELFEQRLCGRGTAMFMVIMMMCYDEILHVF